MDRAGEFSYKRPSHFMHAQVAQLVEHSTENAGVGCSIQPLGTTFLQKSSRLKCNAFFRARVPGFVSIPFTETEHS